MVGPLILTVLGGGGEPNIFLIIVIPENGTPNFGKPHVNACIGFHESGTSMSKQLDL